MQWVYNQCDSEFEYRKWEWVNFRDGSKGWVWECCRCGSQVWMEWKMGRSFSLIQRHMIACMLSILVGLALGLSISSPSQVAWSILWSFALDANVSCWKSSIWILLQMTHPRAPCAVGHILNYDSDCECMQLWHNARYSRSLADRLSTFSVLCCWHPGGWVFSHTLGLLWKEICIVVCFSCKVYDGLILYYQRAVEVPVIF
jgi:hypothetical protein